MENNVYANSSESDEIQEIKHRQEEIYQRLRTLVAAMAVSADIIECLDDHALAWEHTFKTLKVVKDESTKLLGLVNPVNGLIKK